MSGLESVLLKLGIAATNALFASWLRGKTPGARPDESISQLLNRRIPGAIQRRKAQRQLDQVADQVTEQLQEFLNNEFGKVPENEIIAATVLVSDLFSSVERDANFLIASDLDAVKIEKYLRETCSKKISVAAFSQAGDFVFNRVLRETAAYVVELFTALPDYSARALTEILRRETTLLTMAEQILARLPTADEQEENRYSTDMIFETEYRRNVARKWDRLELFGATLSEYSSRYSLSVAYISLTVSSSHVSTAAQALKTGGRAETSIQRVEQALGYGRQRAIIQGEAGSGKTTLLQWLSVMAARKEFSDGLDSWNDLVPVYLPLRRYVSMPLPRPENFLDFTLPNLAGAMPHAWMHRLLASGRVLLLLDGVDELPSQKRKPLADWFKNLTDEFRDISVIVTSRPAALEEGWLYDRHIQTIELLPMSLQDIKSLVNHWHSAVAKDTDSEDELQSLVRYRESLKAIVEERRPIRTLATNPLMCALICALHRDRRAHLPHDRMELYRIALEMLLDRRDRERDVQDWGDIQLTYREKMDLLEDLAYWLIRNGRSDAAIEDVISRIGNLISNSSQIKQSPVLLLTYLLERSGLLRSPVEGRVDFLHRSFQEFLAAKAAVAGTDIPLLIDNGINDQWREVIILAAGHARAEEREVLIRGLLERGRADARNRHRLFLVAVACLETSTQLSRKLRTEVEEALALVIPPKNRDDATAIAAARELATPFLSHHSGASQEVVAACVRALALIGDDYAMRVIKEYAEDRRTDVSREIVRSWPQFPAEEYARQILKNAPLERGSIELPDSSYIDYLNFLTKVRGVQADCLNREALRKIGGLDRIRRLSLSHIDIADFLWLTNSRLEALTLQESTIGRWEGIGKVTDLRRLALKHCKGALLGSLKGLTRLERVDLYAAEIRSLEFLEPIGQSLRFLSITECSTLTTLRGADSLVALEDLTLSDNIGVPSIDELRNLPNLRKVRIHGSYIGDLRPLETVPMLEALRIDRNSQYSLGYLLNKPDLKIVYSDY